MEELAQRMLQLQIEAERLGFASVVCITDGTERWITHRGNIEEAIAVASSAKTLLECDRQERAALQIERLGAFGGQ